MNIINSAPQNIQSKDFAKAVKIALVLNLSMFFVEIICGFYASSMALIVDSFDFLGDSLNYFIAIYVLKKSARIQSYSAFIKGLCMFGFGIFILFSIFLSSHINATLPKSNLMIVTSILALCINLGVSFLLFQFRHGSSNQKSVWLCSRNDAINNILVIIAGILVAVFASRWPDSAVALIMGFLAILSALAIFRAVFKEIFGVKNF